MSNYADMVRRSREIVPELLGYNETWTQETMASLVGVSRVYWGLVERGERQPSEQFKRTLNYIVALAKSGCDPRMSEVW